MNYISRSEIGLVRKTNQDRVLVVQKDNVFLGVVCDGIGGANGGDYASQKSIELFSESFKKSAGTFESIDTIIQWFKTTLNDINKTLYKESRKNMKLLGMGTTAAVIVVFNNRAIGFNVGDSRIYDYRRNRLSVLSHDQTYAYMMYLNNQISIEDVAVHPKRNVLMNAVGVNETITFETIRIPDGWNRLLVCSDGLYGYVPHDHIESQMDQPLEHAKKQLMDMAYKAGGFDNISYIILEGETNV
ncbi:serine/threonine protein phosphatase [Erysipelothrix larvae]|uniref:Serine/threonine protein phosphatase n=1 Tax=Erysipelothrix larvae TaxID=1514105 RepID=A0A109UH15_9FIRM|nr:protein phosphatase 2C domain-containing protein [Erysipelothrix larvae]AMC93438.1 serine/threonine protein phosphatase [Erysipelothrix larvae]